MRIATKSNDPELIANITQNYKNGIGITQLHKQYNISKHTVWVILQRNGCGKLLNENKSKKVDCPKLINDITQDYKSGITIMLLSEKYNISKSTISSLLRKNMEKETLRKTKYKRTSPETIIAILKDNLLGIKGTQLAAIYNVNSPVVSSILRKYKLDPETNEVKQYATSS